VFVAQGYHAAAMDDIADRAGVSKPVLYQHFPSKLDLYLALLDEGTEALVDSVRDALAGSTENKVRVTATMQAYFDFVSDPGGAFRLVFESDLTAEPSVRARVDRVTQGCAELVSAVIAADAGLSEHESHLLAVGLIGTAQVSARYWVQTGEPIPKDEAVRLVSTLAWRGISRFPRAGT
jgi:AcrR family transcriptional regulator